ncbi:MAG: hypothetical protein A2V70_07725 [Planctomycetes bacterium RBG_13_63_9]|nr:MAG: hypothetical protein A2V70_07725 [Planctomycetes bacterium RBG_13_63_9]
MAAWNDWYHVNGNTYGTWLPGDPRGWREKRHKRHVEGDYKHPPPQGSGDELHRHAQGLLAQHAVHLDKTQREIAGRALVERLAATEIEVLVLSLDAIHYHLLARFRDHQVRVSVGRAKKHAFHELHNRGFEGKLWQRRCNVVPINDRPHQLNVFHYIGRHRHHGAWVWTFREGFDWLGAQDP